ncbi:hypothetical protein DHEL01_v212833 [Diaporthe helianthi]|uniref:Uncharacterized protein n=1 Tax=Diaporthe helianthi TaxID=158607 RepID=A0A2P5HEU8_DIAHE|nr:hypothetical protein DHEL01_v212833 [Diaporthe helianthi]
MPVLTSARSDSEFSQLSGHLHGDLAAFFRSSLLLICTFTAAFTALYLVQNFVLPRVSAPRSGYFTDISGISCPPRRAATQDSSDSKPYLLSCWPGARQGQGRFEKQASWAISRGGAIGTAQVRLGGPRAVQGSCQRSMEQEDKTAHTRSKGSRGVSNDSSYGTGQESSRLPRPDLAPFPAAAEESRHARASSPPHHHPPPLGGVGDEHPGPTEHENNSMDDDLVAGHWGYGGFMTTSRSTAPFFSHPHGVADDLGVTYYPDGGLNVLSVVGRGHLTPRHLGSVSTRQAQSRPTASTGRSRRSSSHRMPTARHGYWTPAELGATTIDPSITGYYPEQTPGLGMAGTSANPEGPGQEAQPGSSHYTLATSSSRQKSVARNIPMREGADGFISAGPLDGYLGPSSIANSSFSPSSYPPASPLLPPPPLTDYPFDPAAVMFPGPGAVDGGVRVVYEAYDYEHEHTHEESGTVEAAADTSAHTVGSSWTRHTRVYGGGGACLACAAAGGGGFYGARVRPEDKPVMTDRAITF